MQQFKVDNDVISHLLFHKSLIGENDNSSMINHYVRMLQNTNEGEHISIQDPFDKSIAIAFELVMQHHLNPWDIDLVNFSTMYLEKAKQEKIDLITTGRIIYMAWKILKLQSDDLITIMKKSDETYEPFGWGDIPTELYLTKDDDYSYTNIVMNIPEAPLEEPIRRNAKRKVTLMELLEAFNIAKKESENYILIEKQRKEERERIEENARKRMKGTTHEDHLEEDVVYIWNKINSIPEKMITILDLCEKDSKEEIIKVLMSILFLVYDNKIDVFQKKFPFGKIYIKNLTI